MYEVCSYNAGVAMWLWQHRCFITIPFIRGGFYDPTDILTSWKYLSYSHYLFGSFGKLLVGCILHRKKISGMMMSDLHIRK